MQGASGVIDKQNCLIGLGHILAERGSASYETSVGYRQALLDTSITQDIAADLLLSTSGRPHYKIHGRYYAPCAGDTSVFRLPSEFDEKAHLLRDRIIDEVGDLVVHDRYPDHFHVTLRGFGTMPVLEGNSDLVAVRAAHEPAFRKTLKAIMADESVSRSYYLQPHDIALLGKNSAIAVVIRHYPISNGNASGLQRLFRAFDAVIENGAKEPGPTWHTTLAYRLTKPLTSEEATRFAHLLMQLSKSAHELPAFELNLADLVYWAFSNMDDFHEVTI